MARKYNFIYKRLVKNESDMIGHIAYSIYKAEKISWIEEYKRESGKEPTEADFEQYHKSCCSEQRITNYLSLASSILQTFMRCSADMMAEQVANEVSDKVTENINAHIISKLPKRESLKKRYIHGSLQSMIGTIALPVIIGILLFISKHSLNDLWNTLAEFFASLAQ